MVSDLVQQDICDIELDLLVQAIAAKYHWDLSHYKKASLMRRLQTNLDRHDFTNLSQLIPAVLHDQHYFDLLVQDISVPVTEMFRDPEVFSYLRKQIVPILKTYPSCNIWDAGCATGEEVYSLIITFEEESMHERYRLYATDMNPIAVQRAMEGIYLQSNIHDYEKQYIDSGGNSTLSDYFQHASQNAAINNNLKRNISFLEHNLDKDPAPASMHLIVCRNVFIYFDKYLQEKVTRLFLETLHPGGFLCLGTKETLLHSEYADGFEIIDKDLSIYRKLY